MNKINLQADLHVHTVVSGHAYSTLQEVAREAKGKGLKLLAITDHGPAMPGGPCPIYFANMRIIPRQVEGVEIIRGVEANILEEGTLDLSERLLNGLEFVLAGFHSECLEPQASVEENTRLMIKALENPHVDVISHPGNPRYQIDAEKLVRATKRLGKLVEINNSSFRVRQGSYENCLEIARWAVRLGVMITVNSDCHISYDVGECQLAQEILLAAKVPEELILNTKVERVKDYLEGRKRRLREHAGRSLGEG